MVEVEKLRKENAALRSALITSKNAVQNYANAQFQHLLCILLKKVQMQMKWQQMSPHYEYLSVSMDGFPGFEDFLDNFEGGKLIQPLPNFRPDSFKHIRLFETVEEIKTLSPDLMKTAFIDGDYAILEAPLSISYSVNTGKLSAHFKYVARKGDGIVLIIRASLIWSRISDNWGV
jgi:hypothetical protein